MNKNHWCFYSTLYKDLCFLSTSSDQERGAEKERRIAEELLQKQLEEERARIPRAHPYPYTTDYPVVCIYDSHLGSFLH